MAKPTVKGLKKKLDKVFSEYIRKRDSGICYTCGNVKEWKYQDAGHYISRSYGSTRFDERNVHAQCKSCNVFKGGNMDEYALKLVKQYGPKILKELNKKKWQIKHFEVGELQDLIEKYKEKIKRL